ncbi:MAG TPA: SDR family NAD(P)-dependent oxidoreductase [Terriglobales bacterium]|nr:SDR family NAD(P)-dependent oxidoreductase [Terriglobales bacterium]
MRLEERARQLLSLDGKVAMVTGAASGIGRGIAIRLAEMGASVAVLDVDEEGGLETVADLRVEKGRAIFVKCDVGSGSDCRNAVNHTIASFGKINILCNNAGIAIRKDVVELPEEEWDRSIDVTLKSIYLLSHEVVPKMIQNGGGSIINTGSGWALRGGPRAASYCAAKAGALNLTRAMAIDHGQHNIRVNCVCPGDVQTPMLRSECAQLGQNVDEFMQEAAKRPLGRVGTPDDVANAVLFLASDMSSWVTGTHLVVDGGGFA